MPVEKVLVQALWGPRAESVEGIAHRWSRQNDELAKIDLLLSRWVVVMEEGDGYRELDDLFQGVRGSEQRRGHP